VDAIDSLISFPDVECNIPCPGNPAEICGGLVSSSISRFVRRQGSGMGRTSEILLTIYENGLLVPASGGSVPSSSTAASSSIEPSSINTSSQTLSPVPTPPISTSMGAISLPPPGASSPSSPVVSNPPSTTSSWSYFSSFVDSVQPVIVVNSTTGSSSSSTTGSIGIGFDPGAGSTRGTFTSPGPPLTTPPPSSGSPISRPPYSIIPIIVSTVWIEVCDVCEHGTTQLATTVTVMHCGCTQSIALSGNIVTVPPPRVPMTVTVEECACGEGGAASSTILTVPCSSAIEEASASVAAAMSAWSTELGAQCPTPVPWSGQVIATGPTSRISSPPVQAAHHSEAEPEKAAAFVSTSAESSDVPEMTNSIAPVAGIPSANNGTVGSTMMPVTTQTLTLLSMESMTSASTEESPSPSQVAVAPVPPAETKSAAAASPKFAMAVGAALVGVYVMLSLL
jgi:hypothetical protein